MLSRHHTGPKILLPNLVSSKLNISIDIQSVDTFPNHNTTISKTSAFRFFIH